MRQVTRNGLITVAAAGGVLATFSGGTAFADTAAGSAAGSGALSGNNVNAPVNAPITVCGNTINVLGSLNSAAGCRGGGGGAPSADGQAGASDGIGSGNNIEAPINAPIDACGNSVNVVGLGNTGDGCDGPEEETPPGSEQPGNSTPTAPGSERPGADNPAGGGSEGTSDVTSASDLRTQSQSESGAGELAHTGAGDMIGVAAPVSAGLLIGGFVLYRRASRLAQR
ncbi:chaplin family protein [Streptomyces marispadix]|uniref:Chaplin n=1 Tax=Streptomyces marispadix TaxID=2922868 RepID=A0ABS9SSR1_9ACTN|nr:chaplin family protein [Streptomyces marispadix]MCH6159335.1 chaplin [Streptomyces marispadix]